MPSDLKKLIDIALVIGLISHIRDHYNGKYINNSLKKAREAMKDAASQFPEGLTDKQVSRAEQKILKLENWLREKRAYLYTAVALGLLDEMSMFAGKDQNYFKKLRETEKSLFSAHKYLDRDMEKYSDYKEAERIINYWQEIK